MASPLEIIDEVIREHRHISEDIGVLNRGVPDERARDSLESVQAELIPGRSRSLRELKDKLTADLDRLNTGLDKHFTYEEEALPELLGPLMMRALEVQHRQISREIAETRAIVEDIEADVTDREQHLREEMRIRNGIIGLTQLVENHATTEEKILDMLKQALQEEE